MKRLRQILQQIDGRGYKAYRDIKGAWGWPSGTLIVRHVQGDPFAAPSRVAVELPPEVAGYPEWALSSEARRIGLACLLARTFASRAAKEPGTGSGRGGEIRMTSPGQLVLRQTAVQVAADGSIEARFTVGLPANGRRVRGNDAARLLTETVPALVDRCLVAASHPEEHTRSHVTTNEDAEALRGQLTERGLVAFVASGSSLPRRSGVDDRPLSSERAVPFESPSDFEVELERPNHGPIRGLGIPSGVTLLVGGGYHGKSTLLNAIARGVHNHRPGDGREAVVTRRDALKVQAEDGRAVTGVDISSFIGDLPTADEGVTTPTRRFSTANASGSTSQAAAIVEALECGCHTLLIDEDTAATNFMIRDRRMQALIPSASEPITPLIDRVRSLYEDRKVSSILVVGGSGDYLDVADHVIGMMNFRPRSLTEEARSVADSLPTGREAGSDSPSWTTAPRRPDPASLSPRKGRRARHARAVGQGLIEVGTQQIDVTALSQLPLVSQARTVALALASIPDIAESGASVVELLEKLFRRVGATGLDALDDRLTGDLAEIRLQDVACALNRSRGLRLLTD